jgi:gluconate 2-dehydrogenase gamma chain
MSIDNGIPMKTIDSMRRCLLQAAPGALGLAWMTANGPAIARAAEHARHMTMTTAAGSSHISHLSAAEAAVADAAAAQIIPSDDTPGAREAGVVYFIDYCAGAGVLGVGPEFLASLRGLDATTRERFPDVASFAQLSSPRQVELLRSIEGTPFFAQLHLLVVVGLLASPAYGGNRNGAGWQLIGFDDAHIYAPPFGFYDAEYPGFVPYGGEAS